MKSTHDGKRKSHENEKSSRQNQNLQFAGFAENQSTCICLFITHELSRLITSFQSVEEVIFTGKRDQRTGPATVREEKATGREP